MKTIMKIIAAVLSGWNAFLLATVCRTFAGYIWNIESECIKYLMAVPVAIFVCHGSYLAFMQFIAMVESWFAPPSICTGMCDHQD